MVKIDGNKQKVPEYYIRYCTSRECLHTEFEKSNKHFKKLKAQAEKLRKELNIINSKLNSMLANARSAVEKRISKRRPIIERDICPDCGYYLMKEKS
jgi:hypothetical protein